MPSVFVQSDISNQWLPAQDWQVSLLTGTAIIGSGKNKSNQYLTIPYETQALFRDVLPQLSLNTVNNLSESLDKAIKILSEISSRISDLRLVTTSAAVPTSTPPVPTTVPAQDGGCSAAASVATDSIPQSVPVPTTVPAQDGGCSAAASVASPVPSGAAPLPSTVMTLVPITVTTVPPSDSTTSVPATQPQVAPALPSVTAQGITVNVPLPAVTPAVPAAVPPAQSSLLSKFFASAPEPSTMDSIRHLVQPFIDASNGIRTANISSFEPRFKEVLTRLEQVLSQTRQVLQSDNDFRLWKQLANTFFLLKQNASDRKSSGVLCNLRTGTSRLYIITSLSRAEVHNKLMYMHNGPFKLEPASLNLLKKFA